MANTYEAWKGAVEPAETSPSGNAYQAWKGAVEPVGAAAEAGTGARARLFGTSKLNQSILIKGINT